MRRRSRFRSSLSQPPLGWALALLALAPAPAAADDVRLANGNTFENVLVLEESAERVRIRLAFGEMTLPAAWVERVERSPSALAEYLARQRRLAAAGAHAGEWLDLARWARRRGLEHGYRDALAEAARRDPRLPGLAEHLNGLGWTFDAELGRWLDLDDRRRRAGWMRIGGEWVSPAGLAARREQQAEAQRRRREAAADAADRRLARAVDALLVAALERSARPPEPVYPVVLHPGPWLHTQAAGGWVFKGPRRPPRAEAPAPQARPDEPEPVVRRPRHRGARSLLERQPSSLLPLADPGP